MDGWTIDPPRLRALREQTEIKVIDFAETLGCHHGHYRKFERGTAQWSPELGHAVLRILSERLGRTVTFADLAHPVPARRKTAA